MVHIRPRRVDKIHSHIGSFIFVFMTYRTPAVDTEQQQGQKVVISLPIQCTIIVIHSVSTIVLQLEIKYMHALHFYIE